MDEKQTIYKIKRTLAFVLALIMTFSLPTFVRASEVRAGDQTEDADLTGWTLGNTSTMTGNPADGWQLEFSEMYFVPNGTSYVADTGVSGLQVRLNLSALANNEQFLLQLGTEKGDFDKSSDTNTRRNFLIKRVDDTTLYIAGYGVDVDPVAGSYNSWNVSGFDFAKDHVFEFIQSNGKWVPAIDGAVTCWENDWADHYNTFVSNMPKDRTVVSFAPCNGEGTTTIKDINFTEKPVVLEGNSATLDGTIGYNYYVSLSKKLAGRGDVYMEFSYGDGNSIVQKVTKEQAVYDEASDTYIFTCKLPAKHMADTITAQLYAGEEPVCAYTSSIKEYAEGLLGTEISVETKTLVENMLHYGAYAQKYFKYNDADDKLADKVEGLGDLIVSDVTQDSFQAAFGETELTAGGFGKIVGSNLYLKSETDLKVYIELEDGVNADNLTFTCPAKSSEPLETGSYMRNGKELVTVTIPNIAAHELNKVWEITVAKKGDLSSTGTWKYSVYTYAYNALADSYNPDMTKYGISIKELMKAMYKYNEAALAYKSAQANN